MPNNLATIVVASVGAIVFLHLVDWFRVDRYFYLYMGFSLLLGLYLTLHSFSARARRIVGGPEC